VGERGGYGGVGGGSEIGPKGTREMGGAYYVTGVV
jgi:hypothetical protein